MKFEWSEKENRNWIMMGIIFRAVEWCITLPYRALIKVAQKEGKRK